MTVPHIGFGEWFFLSLQDLSKVDKIAQIFADDGSSWTFHKLFTESVRAAIGLPEIGVKRGDVLALVIRNCHELFSIAIGCFMADIRVVPMIAELSAEDLASNFKVAKPTHILTAPKTVPTVQEAIRLSNLEPEPKILALTDDLYKDIITKGSHTDLETFCPVKIVDPSTHIPFCYFSSGTTGPPKAVLISDRKSLITINNGRASTILHDGPILNISQCNWITWMFSLGRSIFKGRCRVFMNAVDVERILDTITKFKCETWYAPPRVILAVEKALDAYPGVWDISSLKHIISGGDSMRDIIQERLIKKLNIDIYQEYGSTEGGYVFYADISKPVILGSIGKPCLTIKLVDTETGEDIVKPNTPGELYILAKDVMMFEFQGDAKATKEAFLGDWMPTGDLMYFDENGNYFMVERIKEIFKYNGYQVSPSELEVLITQIFEVMEVAVVGKKDPSVGEYPTAVIVKRPGSKLTAEDVHNFLLNYNLPDWKKPTSVIFIDDIPKTSSGKAIRRKLKEMVNSNAIVN